MDLARACRDVHEPEGAPTSSHTVVDALKPSSSSSEGSSSESDDPVYSAVGEDNCLLVKESVAEKAFITKTGWPMRFRAPGQASRPVTMRDLRAVAAFLAKHHDLSVKEYTNVSGTFTMCLQ